jgi:hypothetical protein
VRKRVRCVQRGFASGVSVCLVISLLGPSIAVACEGGGEEGKREGFEIGPGQPLMVPLEPETATATIKNRSEAETYKFVLNNTEALPFKLKSTNCGASLAPLAHCEDFITVEMEKHSGALKVEMEEPMRKAKFSLKFSLKS